MPPQQCTYQKPPKPTMDVALNLVSYYKNEWQEAIFLTVSGIATTGIALAARQQADQDPLLEGLSCPFAFMAVCTVSAGGFGAYDHSQQPVAMHARSASSPTGVGPAEGNHLAPRNDVNTWWLSLSVRWAALAAAGLMLVLLSGSDTAHGMGLGLIFIAAIGFLVDGFALDRSRHYSAKLLQHQTTPSSATMSQDRSHHP